MRVGSRLLFTLYITVLYLPHHRHIYHEKDPYLMMVLLPHSLYTFQSDCTS